MEEEWALYSFNRQWWFNWLVGRSETDHHATGASYRHAYKSAGGLSDITCVWNLNFVQWAKPVSCQSGNTRNLPRPNCVLVLFLHNEYIIYIYIYTLSFDYMDSWSCILWNTKPSLGEMCIYVVCFGGLSGQLKLSIVAFKAFLRSNAHISTVSVDYRGSWSWGLWHLKPSLGVARIYRLSQWIIGAGEVEDCGTQGLP